MKAVNRNSSQRRPTVKKGGTKIRVGRLAPAQSSVLVPVHNHNVADHALSSVQLKKV
jgi:hypothetical protein